jgi:hypothetical protein
MAHCALTKVRLNRNAKATASKAGHLLIFSPSFLLCVFVFICSAAAFKNFALQIFFDDC